MKHLFPFHSHNFFWKAVICWKATPGETISSYFAFVGGGVAHSSDDQWPVSIITEWRDQRVLPSAFEKSTSTLTTFEIFCGALHTRSAAGNPSGSWPQVAWGHLGLPVIALSAWLHAKNKLRTDFMWDIILWMRQYILGYSRIWTKIFSIWLWGEIFWNFQIVNDGHIRIKTTKIRCCYVSTTKHKSFCRKWI